MKRYENVALPGLEKEARCEVSEGAYSATVADVAAWLVVPESTVYRAVAGGRIPCIRVGKHWRFSIPNVRRFFEEQEERSVGN